MKKRICMLCLSLLLLLCFATAFAKADTHVVTNIPIPDRFRPILEVCGAENEEEMFEKLVQFTTMVDPDRAKRLPNWCKQEPIQIHYGGTTKELLADKKWNLAIVSSKDVDLQVLADQNRIYYSQFGFSEPTFHQCLLPDELAAQLPNKNGRFSYDVTFFDYDAEANDATLLLIGDKSKFVGSRETDAILNSRPADMVRELEGIYRAKYWTVDQLLERPDDWDVAFLDLPAPNGQASEELKRLDEAGLLYDLSQNDYLATRTDQTFNGHRLLPRGVFTEDGRMVALPCTTYYDYETDEEEHLLIVNQKSAYVEKAVNYSELMLRIMQRYWENLYEGKGKAPTLEEARSWYEEINGR